MSLIADLRNCHMEVLYYKDEMKSHKTLITSVALSDIISVSC